MHLAELLRLGARLRRQGTMAVVEGTDRLSGAQLTASDLRASAALVLAGLIAEGTTEIHRVYHIDRGYERIEERLRALGARIERVSDRDVLTPQAPPAADADAEAATAERAGEVQVPDGVA